MAVAADLPRLYPFAKDLASKLLREEHRLKAKDVEV